MNERERPLYKSKNSSQSINDFPLPPSTPRLASFSHKLQDDSVPEFDKNFRFPIIDHQIEQEAHGDPEIAFQRLRNEVETLTARLGESFTDLESTIPYQSSVETNNDNNSSRRRSTRESIYRPKTSYGRVETPRFPFNDFVGWDLRHEGDDTNEAESDGEKLILPQVLPRVRASSLHGCKSQQQMREIPEFVIPAHARKFLIASERNRIDEERAVAAEAAAAAAAAAEHEEILRQTQEAVQRISKAGFDFGFGESLAATGSIEDCDLKQTATIDTDIEIDTKTTVITIPSRTSHNLLTPPYTYENQNSFEPCNSVSHKWTKGDLTDSGIALASPPITPHSAPPRITSFPDLPQPLRLNRVTKSSQLSSIDINCLDVSDQQLSCWNESPESQKKANYPSVLSHDRIQSSPIRMKEERVKRTGFWRRIKNSIFPRKRSTSANKRSSCSTQYQRKPNTVGTIAQINTAEKSTCI